MQSWKQQPIFVDLEQEHMSMSLTKICKNELLTTYLPGKMSFEQSVRPTKLQARTSEGRLYTATGDRR